MPRATVRHSAGRRRVLKTLLALGAGTLTGTAAYGYGWARHQLRVDRVDLPLAGWPADLDGLRVALLTDIHCSATVDPRDVARAVTLANAERPDLVVLGGDYVTWADRAYMDTAAELLSAAQAPLGVFAVLGNHDDDRAMPAALARQSIEVLNDARTSLRVRGRRLDLVGIRYWTRARTEIGRLCDPARPPAVLLAHDPRRFAEAAALGLPLVLSGHTHGGQVVVPGLGAPAAKKFPVLSGTARSGATTLYVSRGIGTVYLPIRLNCPPEVSILTLRSAGTAPS
jgi:uncharacterized protein